MIHTIGALSTEVEAGFHSLDHIAQESAKLFWPLHMLG